MVQKVQRGGYPDHWEADVVLRDGGTAHVRPIRPSDADAVQTFHQAQSQASIYLRFFAYKAKLTSRELKRFTTVDHVDRVAFVVTVAGELLGIARYDRLEEQSEAEVAFNISDRHQGRGLGSILLEHLAAAALENGIRTFSAEVLPENRKMLAVFADAGYEVRRQYEDGVIMVEFNIDPTAKSLSVMEAREHRADARSVRDLVAPESVAVIGASRHWGKFGNQLITHIIEGGFSGPVYAVNPDALEVAGSIAYGSISEVPGKVDLAVVAVPYDRVPSVIHECAAVGVRGALIVTDGFVDHGESGLARQNELVRHARSHGMRLVGPASLGIINTDPGIRLNASLAPGLPLPGSLALFSQSAAVGVSMYTSAHRRKVGLSAFLSAGNRADVSGNDAMQYFEDDERSSVVGLFLESFGNPRKFSRIAHRLSLTKPVIVAKPGQLGLRLPPGHAVRATQAPPEAMDAMLRQAGVIRVETMDDLLDVAQILTSQPMPTGNGLAILGNTRALVGIASSLAEEYGLAVAHAEGAVRLDSSRTKALKALSVAVESAQERDDVNAIVVSLIPSTMVGIGVLQDHLRTLAETSTKPLISILSGSLEDAVGTRLVGEQEQKLPCFESPGKALKALADVVGYVAWREKQHRQEPLDSAADEPVRRDEAEALLQRWLQKNNGGGLARLGSEQVARLLDCYAIQVLPHAGFTTEQEAVAAADDLGWPVVLKTTDPALRQRLDLGGVRLNLNDAPSLVAAIRQMKEDLKGYGDFDMEIQHMAQSGQACVIRGIEDPLLGPVISYGISGDATRLLDDWAYRVPPFSVLQAREFASAPAAAQKLAGYAGLPPLDRDGLADLLRKVGRMKDDLTALAMIEMNPVLVSTNSLSVLSCDILIADAQRRTDNARRALRDE